MSEMTCRLTKEAKRTAGACRYPQAAGRLGSVLPLERVWGCGLRGAATGWVWRLAWELRYRDAASKLDSILCVSVEVQLCWLRL